MAAPPTAMFAGPITPEMRADDPRLARKVTVNEPAICFGELLDRLSEQAHVSLSGPNDEVSGEPITVFVKDRPLSDVLQGLYYLFSYRGGEWEWQRTSTAGAFAYHFQPTKAALRFAASIRGEMRNALEYQVEEMIAARGRPGDDLKKDPRPYIAALAEPTTAAGIAVLAESLSATERRALYQGKSITLEGDSLGPATQRFLDLWWEHNRAKAVKAGRTPPGAYTYLSLRTEHPIGIPAPMLLFMAGNGFDRSGSGIAGGNDTDPGWWKRMDALWPVPTGNPTPPPLPDPLPKAIDGSDVRDPGGIGSTALSSGGRREMQAFAAAAKVPVLARLTLYAWSSVAPGTRSVAGFYKNLREGGECGVAWRDGMLLVCRHHWVRPRYTDPLAPWPIRKRLRADIAADPQRLLPVADLVYAAAYLTPPQIEYLQDAETIHGLEAASDLQSLLAPLARDLKRRERLFGKGLAVAALPISARTPRDEPAHQRVPPYAPIAAALSASPNAVIRFRVMDAPEGQPPWRRIELLLRPSADAPERILTTYSWEPTPTNDLGFLQ